MESRERRRVVRASLRAREWEVALREEARELNMSVDDLVLALQMVVRRLRAAPERGLASVQVRTREEALLALASGRRPWRQA